MSLSEDIRPISYLKSHSAKMLKQVNETHRPVIITQNGEAKAVLQDTESYENTRRAMGLLKLMVQSEEDIRQGRLKSQELVFENIECLLSESE